MKPTETHGNPRKPTETHFHISPLHRERESRGFALVVTLSLMVLLMLLALGMLSLSSISLRASSRSDAQAEARANARMALMIAIGELQRSVGPDGNITAPASILDTDPETPEIEGVNQPHLTGVWEARKDALGDLPDYGREAPFRRWLVSSGDPDMLTKFNFVQDEPDDPVLMVPGQDSADGEVHAGRVRVNQGAYAWWVGDENCKAHVALRDDLDREESAEIADLLAGVATPGAHGIQALDGFEEFPSNTETSDKVITRDQLSLAESDQARPAKFFHDLSPYSESILGNVTNGTLRKDLSLYLERDDIDWLEGWGWPEGKSQPPAGPLGPNQDMALSGPRDYDVLSWKSLHHWYNMHRRQIGQGSNFPMAAMLNYTPLDKVSNPTWNSGVLRLAPVMVRMQMILSYGLQKTGSLPNGEKTYDLTMYSYPVLTMWNPYSVALEVDQWSVFLHTLPLEQTVYKNGIKHNITLGGSPNGNFNWGFHKGNMVMRFGDAGTPGITFAPGEVKTLTYITSSSDWAKSHDMVDSIEAWLPPGQGNPKGHMGEARNLGMISGMDTDRIEIETKGSGWDTSGSPIGDFQNTFGFRCEAKAVHTTHTDQLRRQMFCAQVCWRRETDQGNPVADTISKTNFPSSTFRELDNTSSPFLHLDVRLKTLDEPQLPNKTWLHNIPGHPYASATSTKKHQSQGVDALTTFFAHPYTVSFEQINGLEGLIQNQPFFGPSNTPAGRSRIVAQDIPLAPLTSLAQLQNLPQLPMEGLNWSGYYFQNHAIGNSYASPGLAPDSIKERSFPFYLGQYFASQGGDLSGKFYGNAKWFNNDDYVISAAPAAVIDRSFAANHLLFDGYFFSSMAAQQGIIFQRYGSERTLQEVATEFYEGTKQLPNPAYHAYLGGGDPDTVVSSLTGSSGSVPNDAHLRTAAHLMVSGGFNVNSTSVPAWTALLASSHLKRPVTLDAGGGLAAQDRARFVVSRFGAPVGKSADNQPGWNSEDNRWLGYRELTEDEVRQLAEAIVKQVKTRGPFRSLGEFVNRRLTSDPDLALYGALQAALEDPNVTINDNYRDEQITEADLKVEGISANYKFKEAALGSRYQGTPAYISQADILIPIAPILNARSDTFVIRAYGETKSADGQQVLARAWCEAVVQRVPDYLDPADKAHTPLADLTSQTNKTFGRRFTMKSFRWMSPQELVTIGGGA